MLAELFKRIVKNLLFFPKTQWQKKKILAKVCEPIQGNVQLDQEFDKLNLLSH